MTEIPVKTVPRLAKSTEGREGDRQGGPDRGWDQWWLGWHTAGLLDRLYSVLFKPPPIQFHLEKPAWAKSTITGFLAGVM